MNKRIYSEQDKKAFRDYAKAHAPSSTLKKDCLASFLVGGSICLFGEFIRSLCLNLGVKEEHVATLLPVSLIFLSCLLTGFGVYDKIAKVGKAGTLVPITGFANAVCSAALDAKSEGYIFGVGTKMFSVAGPVIVYGSLASVIGGLIYYLTAVL